MTQNPNDTSTQENSNSKDQTSSSQEDPRTELRPDMDYPDPENATQQNN